MHPCVNDLGTTGILPATSILLLQDEARQEEGESEAQNRPGVDSDSLSSPRSSRELPSGDRASDTFLEKPILVSSLTQGDPVICHPNQNICENQRRCSWCHEMFRNQDCPGEIGCVVTLPQGELEVYANDLPSPNWKGGSLGK